MKIRRKGRGKDNDANTFDNSFLLKCQQRADRPAAAVTFRRSGGIVLISKKQTDSCLFLDRAASSRISYKKE